MTQVWTAQFRYPGPHRMDITYATTDRLGKFFAPTKEMVHEYKYGTAEETLLRATYTEKYHNLMLYRLPEMVISGIWDEVMALPYIVLVCYCNAQLFCHRHLAKDYMVEKGATYIGEFIDFHLLSQPKKVIDNFHDEHQWASNFCPSPFTCQGILYPTNEHFFQGWKGTETDRIIIAALTTPGQAKRAGRKLQKSWNWDAIKDEVMMIGLREKFIQNPHLLAKLRASEGFELIEGNTWHDNYWGNCYCKRCHGTPGLNKLGKALMTLRGEL